MTEQQQYEASLEFYYYESRYRGYYHFGVPVPLEVPYHPFERRERTNYHDDGKVKSWFNRLTHALTSKESSRSEEITDYYSFPKPCERTTDLRVIIVSFRERIEISYILSVEFLNMLSLAREPLSFEIIGTGVDIRVQLTCHDYDYDRVSSHLLAYFPECLVNEGEMFDLPFNRDDEASEIAIIDFGLEHEFMLPIDRCSSFSLDPLTSIMAQFENLRTGSVAVLQVLFSGIKTPLARDILYAVSDGMGGSFFPQNPEMYQGAEEKIDSPLFACVIRIASQGTQKNHTEYLARELISSLSFQSDSGMNKLIPLNNEGYDYNQHVMNIFYRQSNRVGMVLNAHELVNFVHYPNNSIVSTKLIDEMIGKPAPDSVLGQKYHLGTNSLGSIEQSISLSDEQRLSHTHVIGVTGTGKSTLLANMFLQDVGLGMGCVMFDPHGDIVDDILKRIPEHRKHDVIVLDPSDTEFPIGFNLLHAQTEAEKLVLSSDLVSAFRTYASAWGDRMTSVLANVIDTFLDSDRGGTLIELKRFLLEKGFRDTFLKTVHDPQLHYFWKHDFPLITRASLSPLLTRIDTFLRPKIIRLMFAQKNGLDLSDIVENNKILLVKLSQGLIGKSNSYLLGTLLVSKLGQVALARQSLSKSERTPYYVYMDEFHTIMTDSLCEMLSGIRKYGMGLILAHQNMEQLSGSPELKESILSNPHIRICFRLGDTDAKLFGRGFSGFEANHLQSLKRGTALMRVGGSTNDFGISFNALEEELSAPDIQEFIVESTRTNYARSRGEVETILNDLFPSVEPRHEPKEKEDAVSKESEHNERVEVEPLHIPSTETREEEVQILKEKARNERTVREHEQLKVKVGVYAQALGFMVVYEQETPDGGRVDVGLQNANEKIACEISVTNTKEYELQNIRKCLSAGYTQVCMISSNEKHLSDIQEKAHQSCTKAELKKIVFIVPSLFEDYLKKYMIEPKPQENIIKGYRVKVKYADTTSQDISEAQKTIAKTVFDNLRKTD